MLDEIFGSATNSKGYKVLHPCIRMIYGDAITEESLREICDSFLTNGYSVENIAFGVGGYLDQQHNRDTIKWAMKTSAASIDGKLCGIFKDPATDHSKASKAGVLALIQKNGAYKTILEDELAGHLSQGWESCLEVVYENGKLIREQKFESIRNLALSSFQ